MSSDIQTHGLMELMERMRVLPDPSDIRPRVDALLAANPSKTPALLSSKVIEATVLRCAGIGVVAGLPGAVPGIGTVAQVGVDLTVTGGEAVILLRNMAAMQYVVAGLHGHDLDADERRDEILIVAGLQSGAVLPAREAGKRVGTKIAAKQFDRHVSGAALRKINQKLGTTVVTKYGTKRGGVALGRLLPFGIGATIGGTVNFATTKAFGRWVLRYYSEIEPGNEPLFVPA